MLEPNILHVFTRLSSEWLARWVVTGTMLRQDTVLITYWSMTKSTGPLLNTEVSGDRATAEMLAHMLQDTCRIKRVTKLSRDTGFVTGHMQDPNSKGSIYVGAKLTSL